MGGPSAHAWALRDGEFHYTPKPLVKRGASRNRDGPDRGPYLDHKGGVGVRRGRARKKAKELGL